MQSIQHGRETDAEARNGLAPTEAPASKLAVSPKPAHAKNRGRIDVMADVLNCCRSPSNKSHVMLFANVNSIVATRMIQGLTETGLLDSVHGEDNIVYLATQKGGVFVAKYLELQRLISPGLVPIESKMNNPNRLNGLNF
jgi:predicted transcriptional regulator